MLKKNIITVFVSLNLLLSLKAQDIHFSQFNESPLLINPAAAGATNADFRAACSYKNQWQSIINPFKTMAFAADAKTLKRGKGKSNYLGVGLSMFTDKAGKSKLATTQGNLNIAYNLRTSNESNFAVGAQVGFFQRSINVVDLKWDNQYDGSTYDPSRPSGETSNFQKMFRVDVGAGFLWRFYDKYSQFGMDFGGSISHINEPRISFNNNGIQTLSMKYIGHMSMNIKMGDMPAFFMPRVMYAGQGPHSEILAGGTFKYILGDDTRENVILNTFSLVSSAVQIGAYYRVKDAVVITAGLEYKKQFFFGMSYDLNTSKLRVASRSRGGMEFCLIYKGLFQGTKMSSNPND